jgi:hypothetical protein
VLIGKDKNDANHQEKPTNRYNNLENLFAGIEAEKNKTAVFQVLSDYHQSHIAGAVAFLTRLSRIFSVKEPMENFVG